MEHVCQNQFGLQQIVKVTSQVDSPLASVGAVCSNPSARISDGGSGRELKRTGAMIKIESSADCSSNPGLARQPAIKKTAGY